MASNRKERRKPMTLHPPFKISARLLPALTTGTGKETLTISIQPTPEHTESGQRVWMYYLDHRNWQYQNNDMIGHESYQPMFQALLAWMSHTGEQYAYQSRKSRDWTYSASFPEHVTQWCADNQENLDMLLLEITEQKHLIEYP